MQVFATVHRVWSNEQRALFLFWLYLGFNDYLTIRYKYSAAKTPDHCTHKLQNMLSWALEYFHAKHSKKILIKMSFLKTSSVWVFCYWSWEQSSICGFGSSAVGVSSLVGEAGTIGEAGNMVEKAPAWASRGGKENLILTPTLPWSNPGWVPLLWEAQFLI